MEEEKDKYQRQKKYLKNKISRVVINTTNEEREEWERIAAEHNVPLATFIRQLMSEYKKQKNGAWIFSGS